MTYPIEIRPFRKAFTQHRNNAKRRLIAFEITFEEWMDWWKTDERWEKRGNRSGNFVMARFGDKGPYKIGNIMCSTIDDNLHKERKGVPASAWTSTSTSTTQPIERLSVSIPPAQHSWLRQRAEAIGISMSEFLRRVIDERVPKT